MTTGLRRETLDAMGTVLRMAPQAAAMLHGSSKYPGIQGSVCFYPVWGGTLIAAEVVGLPYTDSGCPEGFLGFHLHEGSVCAGTAEDPFADAKTHYNPGGCPHPEHAGDFPPLLSNMGYGLLMFYTARFLPEEVIGRTVIIHRLADDFHTQPSGNSGEKIACGEIQAI